MTQELNTMDEGTKDGVGEGADEGVGVGTEGGGQGEGAEGTPAYFIGDLDESTVLERLRYTGEVPDRLSALESRLASQLSPLTERLSAVQKSLGQRAGFEPKWEKVTEALKGYDPALAEALLPALTADLKASLQINALDESALAPFVTPLLERETSRQEQQATSTMLGIIGINPEELVAKDGQGNVTEPKTTLQKSFYAWWGLQDANTQEALKTYGFPLAQALHRFKQWQGEQTRIKAVAAEKATTRLRGGQQAATGQRGVSTRRRLETEADGFDSVFNVKRG